MLDINSALFLLDYNQCSVVFDCVHYLLYQRLLLPHVAQDEPKVVHELVKLFVRDSQILVDLVQVPSRVFGVRAIKHLREIGFLLQPHSRHVCL